MHSLSRNTDIFKFSNSPILKLYKWPGKKKTTNYTAASPLRTLATNTWNKVEIWLSTHDKGDIVTDADRKLAAAIDKITGK